MTPRRLTVGIVLLVLSPLIAYALLWFFGAPMPEEPAEELAPMPATPPAAAPGAAAGEGQGSVPARNGAVDGYDADWLGEQIGELSLPSLEMKEATDFLLTPALLVQEAISPDVIITYPTE